MEILELKITISEIKNSIDEVNSHCITADERINEVKEILIENNYSKERTKQKTLERERKRQRDREISTSVKSCVGIWIIQSSIKVTYL